MILKFNDVSPESYVNLTHFINDRKEIPNLDNLYSEFSRYNLEFADIRRRMGEWLQREFTRKPMNYNNYAGDRTTPFVKLLKAVSQDESGKMKIELLVQ